MSDIDRLDPVIDFGYPLGDECACCAEMQYDALGSYIRYSDYERDLATEQKKVKELDARLNEALGMLGYPAKDCEMKYGYKCGLCEAKDIHIASLQEQMKSMQHYMNCSHGKYHQIEGYYCNINKGCKMCGDWQPKEKNGN